jgi:hypothetical protein
MTDGAWRISFLASISKPRQINSAYLGGVFPNAHAERMPKECRKKTPGLRSKI